MDYIRELYWVEHEALAVGIVRTSAHKAWRQEKSKLVLAELNVWLEKQAPQHPPKGPGPMGMAISNVQGQWEALCRFVEDERLPLDNNRSERALRTAAVDRKNFLMMVEGSGSLQTSSWCRTTERQASASVSSTWFPCPSSRPARLAPAQGPPQSAWC